MLDQAQQAAVLAPTPAAGLGRPGAIAAAADAQGAAHGAEAELVAVRLNERGLRLYTLARQAEAYFMMSRSSVTRLVAAWRRRTSADSLGAVWPLRWRGTFRGLRTTASAREDPAGR